MRCIATVLLNVKQQLKFTELVEKLRDSLVMFENHVMAPATLRAVYTVLTATISSDGKDPLRIETPRPIKKTFA